MTEQDPIQRALRLAVDRAYEEGYRLGFADGEGSLEGSPNAPAYWAAEEDGYKRARQNIELGIDPMPEVRNPYVEYPDLPSMPYDFPPENSPF